MKAFFSGYFFIVLAVIAGMTMPTQAVINNKLADHANSPVLAVFISFVIGTVGLFVYILATGISLEGIWSARNAPAIAWTGGLLGAFFVASAVILVPRLGVALTFSLIVAGQMIVTLVIDHYGLLGVPVKEVSVIRVVGVTLITMGVVLIRKF